MKKIFTLMLLFVFCFGCAKRSQDLKPVAVAPEVKEKHLQFTCTQLEQKYYFIEKKMNRNAKQLAEKSKNDGLIAATGWLLYGVPYLFLGGNKENEEAQAKLLGLKEYLEELIIDKDCKGAKKIINVERRVIVEEPANY